MANIFILPGIHCELEQDRGFVQLKEIYDSEI
jgi:hypothetical protein